MDMREMDRHDMGRHAMIRDVKMLKEMDIQETHKYRWIAVGRDAANTDEGTDYTSMDDVARGEVNRAA